MGCVDEATTSALRVAPWGRSHLAERTLEVGAAPALRSQAVQVPLWPGTRTPVIASKTELGENLRKRRTFYSHEVFGLPCLLFLYS